MGTAITEDIYEVYEDHAPFIMDHIKGADGEDIAQADFSTITYTTIDRKTEIISASGSLTIADVVFDTLQTSDARWTKNATGYNFAFTLPATALPTAGRLYEVDVEFTPTSGSAWATKYLIRTVRRLKQFRNATVTFVRGDTNTLVVKGLGDISSRTKLWFTAKRRYSDADTAAIVKIEETAQLEYLEGAAPVAAANGTITVDAESTGDLTILLKPGDSVNLKQAKTAIYDIQMLTATGVTTLAAGKFLVDLDVTRATS